MTSIQKEKLEEFKSYVDEHGLEYEIQKQEDEYGHWCDYPYVSLEEIWGNWQYRIVIIVQ